MFSKIVVIKISAMFLIILNIGLVWAAKKPNTLSMLFIMPITGDEPRTGLACKAATEVVLNVVNARSDILPDYHIEPVYADEGPNSFYTIKNTFKFRQSYEEGGSNWDNATLYQAPIILGPWWAGGCVLGSTLNKHLDIVQIATGCGTPQVTAKRNVYPNLYRIRGTGELNAYPQLNFIKRTFGRRFGILTYALNIFDYTLAAFLMKEAVANDFEVSFFDCVPDFDDNSIISLKQSDTRVVVLDVAMPPIIMRFLCQTFKFGIRGPRYSFILMFAAYFDPTTLADTVAPGCTRQMIQEQLKQTFWIAWASMTDDPLSISALGYNFLEFDRMFSNYTGNAKLADYDKRAGCHDNVLEAVLALDNANKMLEKRNLSLKNYRDMPSVVMKAVNDSVANIDFQALRISRFRYSARSELDEETYVAVQWVPPGNRSVIYSFRPRLNSNAYSFSSYTEVKLLSSPTWFTKDGKAPRDKWSIETSLSSVPEGYFWFVVAVSAIFCAFQIVALCLSIMREIRRATIGTVGFPYERIFITFGCWLFNAAAITFSVRADSKTPSSYCLLQRIFCVLAFAFVQGPVFSRLFFHNVLRDFGRINITRSRGKKFSISRQSLTTTTSRQSTVNSLASRRQSSLTAAGPPFNPAEHIPRRKLVTLFGTGLLLLLSAGYLIAWMIVDSPSYVFTNLTPDGRYNFEKDTYSYIEVYSCKSLYDSQWVGALVAGHGVLVCLGAMFAYGLRNNFQAKHYNDLNHFRLAATNLTTLLAGAVLLVVVLTSSPTGQLISLSIFAILISGITSVVAFWSTLRNSQ